jgi:hypothetical protein
MADEKVPLGQGVGLIVSVELQNVPAGHRVNLFDPSAAQNAPKGQRAQLVMLNAPVDSR